MHWRIWITDMWIAILIVIILLLLAEIFALLTMCRRGHSYWKLLRKYRYAHRGYHGKDLAPENSILAYKEAIRRGFGVELDVHLMQDGNLAVIHDASLLRTAGADVLVEDLTARELKAYRLEGVLAPLHEHGAFSAPAQGLDAQLTGTCK